MQHSLSVLVALPEQLLLERMRVSKQAEAPARECVALAARITPSLARTCGSDQKQFLESCGTCASGNTPQKVTSAWGTLVSACENKQEHSLEDD